MGGPHALPPRLPRARRSAEFPDLDGPGALAYAEWLRAHADRDPDLPAALVPAAIEVDGRQLEPLLLALFRERAEPLADFLTWLAEPAGGRGVRRHALPGRAPPLPARTCAPPSR